MSANTIRKFCCLTNELFSNKSFSNKSCWRVMIYTKPITKDWECEQCTRAKLAAKLTSCCCAPFEDADHMYLYCNTTDTLVGQRLISANKPVEYLLICSRVAVDWMPVDCCACHFFETRDTFSSLFQAVSCCSSYHTYYYTLIYRRDSIKIYSCIKKKFYPHFARMWVTFEFRAMALCDKNKTRCDKNKTWSECCL